MKNLRKIILSICVLGLTACTNFMAHNEVEALNEVRPVGSPFTQYLALEYREYANSKLYDAFDFSDALHFARKGLAAAKGDTVLPEPVSDWHLSPDHIRELGTARGRLVLALDGGGRDIVPQQAAIAQSRFDCWIEQQEENAMVQDVESCAKQFMAAMEALEKLIAPPPPPTEEVPALPVDTVTADTAPPMKAEDAMYLVFFDFDKSEITAGGQSVVDAIADEVKGRNLSIVRVVGHTDSSGPNTYNNKLAMRRANAVRDALTQRGVDASLIRVESRGEDELLVQTPDNVREPANRRSQITFK